LRAARIPSSQKVSLIHTIAVEELLSAILHPQGVVN